MPKGIFVADVETKALTNAFRMLPKEVQAEIRKHNRADSNDLAKDINQTAYYAGVPPQAELIVISGGVTPKTDRNIRVDVGGRKIALSQRNAFDKKTGKRKTEWRANKKTGKNRQRRVGVPVGALVWGAELGSSGKSKDRKGRNMGPRFVERHNSRGYWLQPTVRNYSDDLIETWKRRIQIAVDRNRLGIS